MIAAAHYLPARYYAQLFTRLLEWGVDTAALLRDAGISPETLHAADGQLTVAQVEAVATLAVARAQRTDLGFELGRMLRLNSHDILGYALLSAATLDDALRLVARYFSLITPTYAMRYRRDAHVAEVVFQPRLSLSSTVLNFHLEAIAVAFYEHITTLLSGEPPGCAIYFSFEPPPHAERYHELGAAQVHFGHETLPGARLVLDKDLVLRPLAMADKNAMRMAEARCNQLLQTITRNASLASWVHMMLYEAADGQPGLEELASILNLSPRTLERRLAAEGKGFRHIAQQARLNRATELLRAGRLSVTQIAYQLGYTDVANFTRAFKREAGVAPSEFLRQY